MWMLWRLFLNLLKVFALPLFAFKRLQQYRHPAQIVHIKLDGAVTRFNPNEPWWMRFVPKHTPNVSLEDINKLCNLITIDRHLKVVYVECNNLSVGWADLVSLRRMFSSIQSAEKTLVLFLPHGGGNRELFLASVFDEVVVPRSATFGPLGLASVTPYMKDTLEQLGVEFEIIRAGDFKAAGENLVRSTMSEAQATQVKEMLNGIWDEIRNAWREKGLEDAPLDAVFSAGLVHPQTLLEQGFITEVGYEDGLANKFKDLKRMRAGVYLKQKTARAFVRLRAKQSDIAVLALEGAIGMPGSNIPWNNSKGIDAKSATHLIRELKEDDTVKACVLYIDSPGGSAHQSDLIWHELEILAQQKPLYAYFGNVVASGGYYLAAAAKRMGAEPLAITGSIGVIAMKPVLDGALSKWKLNLETVKTHPHADFLQSPKRMNEQERERFQAYIQDSYQDFLQVVAHGRKKTVAEIEPLAGGRVYLAKSALGLGLLDSLEPYESFLESVKADLQMPRANVEVHVPYHHQPAFPEPNATPQQFLSMMKEPLLRPQIWMWDPISYFI